MNEARAESQARMGYACKKEEGKANDNNIKYLIHKRSNMSL